MKKSAQNDAKRVRDETAHDATTADQIPIEKKRKLEQTDNVDNDNQVKDAIVAAADDNTKDDDDNDDSLKLDGLNNDCLRHIFEYLTLPQLINVAETSGRFVFPAAEAFSRRYGWQKVIVCATTENPILVADLERLDGTVVLTALNQFGARMKTISAYFHDFEKMIDNPIEVLLLKKFTDSLVDFEMHYCSESHFQSIIKPFPNVKNLTLEACTVGANFFQLNRWFPNLTALKLTANWWSPSIVLQTKFEHLTHLSVINDGFRNDLSPQAIHPMLRLNPQLKSLQLQCNYGFEMLQTITELNQLEMLELSTPQDGFGSFEADQKFAFPGVKIFTLYAPKLANCVVKMPFSLKNVQELRLYGFNQFHSQVGALISSGDLLNTISMLSFQRPRSTADPNHPNALACALRTRRHLSELQLCSDEFEGDDLAQMIGACEKLQRLRLVSLQGIPFNVTGLEHDWVVCGHETKSFSVNMGDDDSFIGCKSFDQMCMQRKQLK